jgi:hypothetical protein
MKKTNYIQGAFIKQSKNESFIDFGIKKKEFLESIEGLVADEKGFINLTIGKQKADPSKYSLWLNEWKPDSSKKSSKPTYKNDSAGEDNDLPF